MSTDGQGPPAIGVARGRGRGEQYMLCSCCEAVESMTSAGQGKLRWDAGRRDTCQKGTTQKRDSFEGPIRGAKIPCAASGFQRVDFCACLQVLVLLAVAIACRRVSQEGSSESLQSKRLTTCWPVRKSCVHASALCVCFAVRCLALLSSARLGQRSALQSSVCSGQQVALLSSAHLGQRGASQSSVRSGSRLLCCPVLAWGREVHCSLVSAQDKALLCCP
eukprot:scaffold50779_cov17-Tisochrysis_lutea.AAC.1